MATVADKPEPEEVASYTWGGQRARPRKGIEGTTKRDETYLKPPGSCLTKYPNLGINVDIECCEKCSIYILDPCERVQISECTDCRIVVAPCVGSLMLFDCKRCTMTVASKQVRLRDCHDCDLRVFAAAHECVVIETSKNLRIGAWDVAYKGLAAQFASTGWFTSGTPGSYVNHSSAIHDFSPPPGGGKNWSALGADASGRWCELSVESVDGFNGGAVKEKRTAEPSTEGAECPCAAPDDVLYEAAWYSAAADHMTLSAKPAAEIPPITKAAAPPSSSSAAGATTQSGGSGSWFSRLFCWLTGRSAEPQPESEQEVNVSMVKIKGQETQVCIVS